MTPGASALVGEGVEVLRSQPLPLPVLLEPEEHRAVLRPSQYALYRRRCQREALVVPDHRDRRAVDRDLAPGVLLDQGPDPPVGPYQPAPHPPGLVGLPAHPLPDVVHPEEEVVLEELHRALGGEPPADGGDHVGDLHPLDRVGLALPGDGDVPGLGVYRQGAPAGLLDHLPGPPCLADEHGYPVLGYPAEVLHGNT